jgi:hypothetical protein
MATMATTTEQAMATRAAVASAVAGRSAAVAVGHTVATMATAMTAVTGDRLLLAAHQGQPNNREQNRDSQN